MDIERLLLAITCITSTLTFLCVTIAILPRMKEGMVVVRDATLWIVFGLIVVTLGWGVWQNMKPSSDGVASKWLLLPTSAAANSQAVKSSEHGPTPMDTAGTNPPSHSEPSPDPFYRRANSP